MSTKDQVLGSELHGEALLTARRPELQPLIDHLREVAQGRDDIRTVRAGVTMRRGGPPAHPASTQQILEPRDQGLAWTEVAQQVDMTVSGAWYRKARPPKSPPLGQWAAGSRRCT
jgi:hypothetical protein